MTTPEVLEDLDMIRDTLHASPFRLDGRLYAVPEHDIISVLAALARIRRALVDGGEESEG